MKELKKPKIKFKIRYSVMKKTIMETIALTEFNALHE